MKIFFINLIGLAISQCGKVLIRKEIRELSPQELKKYFAAVHTLHNNKNKDGESIHDRFARIHLEARNNAHGTPALLPWHREFIRAYEIELQKIDSSITLPYWDWTFDYKDPQTSPIFTSLGFGGNGNKAKEYCVQDGQFSNWTLKYPNQHCLKREFYENDRISSFISPENMVALLYKDQSYGKFIQELEIHHSDVHVNVGGYRGDMLPHTSPNDPIFYLHHTFIDMLWHTWQRINPKRSKEYNGKHQSEVEAKVTDSVFYYNVSVFKTLELENNPRYCYKYSDYIAIKDPKANYDDDDIVESSPPPKSLGQNSNPLLQALGGILSINRGLLNEKDQTPASKFMSSRLSLSAGKKKISPLKEKFMKANGMNVTLAQTVTKLTSVLDTLVKNEGLNEKLEDVKSNLAL